MRVSSVAIALSCAASLCPVAAGAQTVLELADVLARARAQAQSIVSARLAVAEARGRLTGASLRLQFNPELDLNAGNRQTISGRWTDLQFGLNQTLEPGGRRSARIAAATALVDQTTVSVDEATRGALRDAALLFYQALYASERVRLLTASAELAASILQVADRRHRAGDLAVLDVHLARAALARARAQAEAGEAEQAAALGGLRALLRADGAIAVRGALALPAAPDAEALARTVDERPELRALEAAIREADADQRVARTFLRPNYGIGLRYQREGGDNIVFGGVTLALPVFARGQELFATGTARGARLRAELDAARLRVHIELQSAIAAYEHRAAAVRVIEAEALPGLDDTDTLTTRSFDVGQIGLPDVLVIRRELLDTRFQHLSALLEAALARVQVDAAAGVLR
jgi:cobalt-zinc-cadmium efflux system outer membrane protein